MTRIIAGSARGQRLTVPPGSGTRPTADRVREAVMGSVTHQLGSLVGVAVLDLYAGSGALGLEAASRGAAQVELVERDRNAARVITANAARLGMGQARVVVASVATHLRGPATAAYDLVFLDPPYALSAAELGQVLTRLADPAAGWLAPDALVVVERAARDRLEWPTGMSGSASRTYSQTTVWYGRRDAPAGCPTGTGTGKE